MKEAKATTLHSLWGFFFSPDSVILLAYFEL